MLLQAWHCCADGQRLDSVLARYTLLLRLLLLLARCCQRVDAQNFLVCNSSS